MSTSSPYTISQHMLERMSKKCRNFGHIPSHPSQLFTLTSFLILMCWEPQFLMDFNLYYNIENLLKLLPK
jgi:hypothetical protein